MLNAGHYGSGIRKFFYSANLFFVTELTRRMEERRPDTRLIVFEQCGHGVHSEDLNGYYHKLRG